MVIPCPKDPTKRIDPETQDWLQRRVRLVLDYLERLSADSAWAHRASGLRGSLWAALETPQPVWDAEFETVLRNELETAFWMLKQAAMEIPDPEGHF